MEINTQITYIIPLSLFFICIVFLLNQYLKQDRRRRFVNNFANYISLLEFYQGKAYDIIYKDKLLVYSLEATKIKDSEFEVISKDFCKLVLKLIGPQFQTEFKDMLGMDALFFNMMEYFNNRYEEDEVRKESVENLMQNDIEDQK